VSGNHMLEIAAEDAVRQWNSRPATGLGGSVTVNFSLASKHPL